MEPLQNKTEDNSPAPKHGEKGRNPFKPTAAFIGASWIALLTGAVGYCIGLWNANMQLNEKGYYLTILLFGLFAVVSVQKSVRDRAEGLPVTDLYYGLSWFATISSMLLLTIGLWNAGIALSEKGFYAMAFGLSMFSAIAVQKNTRDSKMFQDKEL
ncbi:inner membrane protein YiaA [Chitinophaga pinensis]|uniref:YiaAB two helix domain protein n=1 Tax=Chitinophaga pinensis (strain ATCC 43595 / DSM 2588 / LMG 13176 / NBRC 15968 / NCIMB 11800 / UQM 2034) TaxID=485918 RepID=A0A979G4W8_CHIPD|nr:inner membrane protein YiaA [Chitinophaga pinensis]ACU60945.1 YiaAB two helix domain protein [Chitinophaga pinensis DSM 2588]